MKRNDNHHPDIKITTSENKSIKDEIKAGLGKGSMGPNVLFKPGYEPPTESYPDVNELYEERSNPLSSRGN